MLLRSLSSILDFLSDSSKSSSAVWVAHWNSYNLLVEIWREREKYITVTCQIIYYVSVLCMKERERESERGGRERERGGGRGRERVREREREYI